MPLRSFVQHTSHFSGIEKLNTLQKYCSEPVKTASNSSITFCLSFHQYSRAPVLRKFQKGKSFFLPIRRSANVIKIKLHSFTPVFTVKPFKNIIIITTTTTTIIDKQATKQTNQPNTNTQTSIPNHKHQKHRAIPSPSSQPIIHSINQTCTVSYLRQVSIIVGVVQV